MTTLPLQNMKIRIKDAEHSDLVIQVLTRLGYNPCWLNICSNGDVGAIYTRAYSGEYITADCNERLDGFFTEQEEQEVTLEDLQAMLAEADGIPEDLLTGAVETASVSIPSFSLTNNYEGTVNIYISQIQKRLVDTNLSVSIYGDEIRVANTDNDNEVGVKSWDDVLEIIKVKQAYLNVFKGTEI